MAIGGRKNIQPYEFNYFFNKTTSSGGSDADVQDD
jgi:hypothetical protein